MFGIETHFIPLPLSAVTNIVKPDFSFYSLASKITEINLMVFNFINRNIGVLKHG